MDCTFKYLDDVLSVDKVTQFFQQYLSEKEIPIQIKECRVVDIKLILGVECVVLFKLKLQEPSGHSHKFQMIGYLFESEPTKDELASLFPLTEFKDHPFLKEAWTYYPAYQTVFCFFPYDIKMPNLPDLLSRSYMKSCLNILVKAQKQRIGRCKIKLLGYTPLMRAAIHYKLTVQDQLSGAKSDIELIGKINVFKPADHIYSLSTVLWNAIDQAYFAEPFGCITGRKLYLQKKVSGARLGNTVEQANIHTLVEKTAHALGLIHNANVPLPLTRRLAEDVNTITRWQEALGGTDPQIKKRVDLLCKKIINKMSEVHQVLCPIHADFHHTNVLAHDNHIYIIDLDEVCYGDPAVDIGRFLSSLRIPAIRIFDDIHALDALRDRFLSTYLKDHPISEQKIGIFESAALITSAGSAFRLHKLGWEANVDQLLTEAEKTIEKSDQSIPQNIPCRYLSTEKPSLVLPISDRKKWGRDLSFIRSIIAPRLYEMYQSEIIKVTLRKEKNKRDSLHVLLHVELKTNKTKIKIRVLGVVYLKDEIMSKFRAEKKVKQIDPNKDLQLIGWHAAGQMAFYLCFRKTEAYY